MGQKIIIPFFLCLLLQASTLAFQFHFIENNRQIQKQSNFSRSRRMKTYAIDETSQYHNGGVIHKFIDRKRHSYRQFSISSLPSLKSSSSDNEENQAYDDDEEDDNSSGGGVNYNPSQSWSAALEEIFEEDFDESKVFKENAKISLNPNVPSILKSLEKGLESQGFDIELGLPSSTGSVDRDQIRNGAPPPTSGANRVGPTKLKGLARNSEEDNKRRVNNELLVWLEDNGVYLSELSGWGVPPHALSLSTKTIDEVEMEDSGRGLIARKSISQGNALFQLPISILMTKKKAKDVLGADVITKDFSEYLAIALLLIHERYVMKENSFWRPYINILPESEEVNPSIVWKDEELDLLQGSKLLPATISLKAKLKQEYATLEKTIFDRYPERFDKENIYTFENFQWAFINIFSRAIRVKFSVGDRIILCPYADLINHNPFSNTYVTAEKPWRMYGLGQKAECVTVYADRNYKKFEQVYISYGPKSNTDLLLLYGFCLDRNPFNSVELTVNWVDDFEEEISGNENDENYKKEKQIYELKKKYLKAMGTKEQEEFPLFNDRYPNELFEFLRIVYLDYKDWQEACFGAPIEQLDFTEPISAKNEFKVLTAIESGCIQALDNYTNTEEEDTKMIMDTRLFNTLPKTMRMAIKHRRAEKRLLKRTIAAVQQQLKNYKNAAQTNTTKQTSNSSKRTESI